jgi:hypothetical protein
VRKGGETEKVERKKKEKEKKETGQCVWLQSRSRPL